MVKQVWHEPTTVWSSETDFRGRWKISAFFAAMVEAAAHHADHLGFGFESMMSKDQIWLLSRLKIRFFSIPRIEDAVIVETWPRGIGQKVFFLRDYHILNQQNQILASATSGYLLVSPSARRILPPQMLAGNLPFDGSHVALDEPLEKLAEADSLAPCATVHAGYSAVDLLGHVNNTRYVDWIMDCFPFAHHEQHELRWLQINFVNEVRPGEQVALSCGAYAQMTGSWYVGGSNLTTGMKSFDANVGWEAAA